MLSDAIHSGRSVEEREAAIAQWEEERAKAANYVAVIADQNVRATLLTDGAAAVLQATSDYMTRPDLRRNA